MIATIAYSVLFYALLVNSICLLMAALPLLGQSQTTKNAVLDNLLIATDEQQNKKYHYDFFTCELLGSLKNF